MEVELGLVPSGGHAAQPNQQGYMAGNIIVDPQQQQSHSGGVSTQYTQAKQIQQDRVLQDYPDLLPRQQGNMASNNVADPQQQEAGA